MVASTIPSSDGTRLKRATRWCSIGLPRAGTAPFPADGWRSFWLRWWRRSSWRPLESAQQFPTHWRAFADSAIHPPAEQLLVVLGSNPMPGRTQRRFSRVSSCRPRYPRQCRGARRSAISFLFGRAVLHLSQRLPGPFGFGHQQRQFVRLKGEGAATPPSARPAQVLTTEPPGQRRRWPRRPPWCDRTGRLRSRTARAGAARSGR